MPLGRDAFGSVLFALVGSGCSASIAPIEVAAGCPGRPAHASAPAQGATDEALIDDFEHEGNALPRRGDRNGMWALGFGSDGEIEASGSDQCAARGRRAGHFAGSMLSNGSPNWTAVLRSPAGGVPQLVDASTYGGISFWAAAGPDVATPYALQVGVTTPAPSGGRDDVACPGCMGYYVDEVSLEHHWQRFDLRFADLVQFENGNPRVPLRLDTLVGLTFWPEQDFDIWLDDVRFEP